MIDLHTHTTISDGTLTPTEIIDLAYEKNLEVVSITDHDTTEGLAEGRKRAEELGIIFIDGIEFSSEWEKCEVHILGYFIDLNNEKLKETLAHLKIARIDRNTLILKKLKEHNIEILESELEKEAKGDIVSRAHIGQIILDKGYAYSKGEVFKKYLGINGVAYVPKGEVSPEEIVETIVKSGGIASLAHPHLMSKDTNKVEELVKKLKKKGLQGIEVYYPSLLKNQKKMYKRIAKKNGLILTGGSDYHGENRGNVTLGQAQVPLEVYDAMKNLIKKGS